MNTDMNSPMGATTTADDSQRFSSELVPHLTSLLFSVRSGKPFGLESVASLEEAWRRAAFLGCPTVASLTRSILAVLRTAQEKHYQILKDNTAELEASIESLIGLVKDTSDLSSISVADMRLEELQREFTTVDVNWAPVSASGTQVSLLSSGTPATTSEHKDSNIYCNSVIDGLERCSEEETWIVSQLAAATEDLAASAEESRPAHQLMRVLMGHRYFKEVDRVCIAGLVRDANQLVVIDSCLHQRMKEMGVRNKMPKGYSCYVNPEGSLAEMKPGVLRIFAESKSVLGSFARQGRPAQRSIAHISESGLKSGICLAIGRSSTVQGFLFMNSHLPGYFQHVQRDYGPLLSLFSLLGTVALDGAGFHCQGQDRATLNSKFQGPQAFSAANFESLFQEELALRTTNAAKVSVATNETSVFLYAPSLVIRSLADIGIQLGIISVTQFNRLHIDVRVESSETVFELSSESNGLDQNEQSWMQSRLEEVAKPYALRPASYLITETGLSLRIPYEPSYFADASIRYSIAY